MRFLYIFAPQNFGRLRTSEKRDEFKLRIAGVELGKHSFSIVCNKEFFELADLSDLLDGQLLLDIKMEKSEIMMQLSFFFRGDITIPCDRCLDPVTLPMNFEEKLIVKYDNQPQGNEDDMIWTISENEYELDVFHFVYESISLALPTQVIHPEDENGSSTCNPEILKRLVELSHKEEERDPRWDALKKIDLNEN